MAGYDESPLFAPLAMLAPLALLTLSQHAGSPVRLSCRLCSAVTLSSSSSFGDSGLLMLSLQLTLQFCLALASTSICLWNHLPPLWQCSLIPCFPTVTYPNPCSSTLYLPNDTPTPALPLCTCPMISLATQCGTPSHFPAVLFLILSNFSTSWNSNFIHCQEALYAWQKPKLEAPQLQFTMQEGLSVLW